MGLNRVETTYVEVAVEKETEIPTSRIETTYVEVAVSAHMAPVDAFWTVQFILP